MSTLSLSLSRARFVLALVAVAGLVGSQSRSRCVAATITWSSTVNGSWNQDANWNPATGFPNTPGDIAALGSSGFSATSEVRTITVDSDVAVGGLDFQISGASNRYVVNGPNAITLDGTGNASIGSLHQGSFAHTLAAPLRVNVPVDLNSGFFPSLTISSNISGTGTNPNVTFNKLQSGTVTFSGNNNLGNGVFNINAGSLMFTSNALGAANAAGGANTTVNLNNASLTLNGANGLGGTNDFGFDLVVDGSGTSTLITSKSSDNIGNVQIGSLTVRSNNTLSATATGGFGFNLRINAGEVVTVEQNGTLNWTSGGSFRSADLILLGGSALRGTGTVTTNDGNFDDEVELRLRSGAKVAPGFSAGILNIGSATNNDTHLVLESGAIFEAELNGSVAGLEYDVLNLTGTANIGGSILDAKLGYGALNTDKLFILQNDGTDAITGTFQGLANGGLVDMGLFNNVAATARISYFGDLFSGLTTGGNDIVLYDFDVFVPPVPEPSTFVLFCVGLTLLGVRSRFLRRNKQLRLV